MPSLEARMALAIRKTRALLERHGVDGSQARPEPETPTLDGLVCPRCDAFGHDADDCPAL